MNKSILDVISTYVGMRETDGKNRAPWIDEINLSIGVPLGSPYCASGISHCFNIVYKSAKPSTKRKFPSSASSQAIKNSFKKLGLYTEDVQELKNFKGALFGWTNEDKIHGHIGLVIGRLTDESGKIIAIETLEFNTNTGGSRNGDGVYILKRSLINPTKKYWFCDTSDIVGGNYWV